MRAEGQLIVRRLFDEVFNARAYEVIPELVSDDFVEHAIAPFGAEPPGAVAGVAHMQSVVEWLTAQFPDICMSVEAPRAKPMIPTHATVIKAASKCPPGRNLRMCR